ncbi:universal stress protein [Bordetella petrii]|uniref:universal stress protein n=1 Tax=Bordetella petrii TaxID=94624 RepID=UPI0037304659
MYQHILIPIDGSELSRLGLTNGLALAKALQARVTIMTAIEPINVLSGETVQFASVQQQYERQARERARQWLADAADQARQAGVACDTAIRENSQPYLSIIECAAQGGCDLITMSSHGRSGMAAVMVGSQTQKVLTKSKIPVLVYR